MMHPDMEPKLRETEVRVPGNLCSGLEERAEFRSQGLLCGQDH